MYGGIKKKKIRAEESNSKSSSRMAADPEVGKALPGFGKGAILRELRLDIDLRS